MKRVLLITAFSFMFFAATKASIIPTEATLLIDHADVEVSLIDMDQKDIFEFASFNDKSNSFDFETKEKISFIQVFNANGALVFQMPVESNKVRINKQLFEKGKNRLGFVIEGYGAIEYTGVKVK